MIKDAKKQQVKLDALCVLSGTVAVAGESTRPIIVGLARHTGGDVNDVKNWTLADHFVLENAGRWVFRTGAGTYGLAAFEDRNSDGVYEPNEPYLRIETDKVIQCKSNERLADLKLTIPAQGRSRIEGPISFADFKARASASQEQISLGAMTVYGKVTTMDDPKFAAEIGSDSLWRPYDFIVNVGPGVYFLEPYDAKKIPVLFVHGINGSPIVFRELIKRLDRSKYQPFMYYYPSGAHLDNIADHLDQVMKALQLEYGFSKHYVVSHSMGGLVSRGYVLRNQTAQSRAKIPLYITVATPWAGHKAAEAGVKWSPTVVRVWNDMVPGSPYIHSLFFEKQGDKEVHRALPDGMKYHMLFSYKGGGRSECNDGTVTLESELYEGAQADATRIYAFNETHKEIIETEATAQLINKLMDEASR
jgi:pimeloyl-ACP methyl ester carboxylesterase